MLSGLSQSHLPWQTHWVRLCICGTCIRSAIIGLLGLQPYKVYSFGSDNSYLTNQSELRKINSQLLVLRADGVVSSLVILQRCPLKLPFLLSQPSTILTPSRFSKMQSDEKKRSYSFISPSSDEILLS